MKTKPTEALKILDENWDKGGTSNNLKISDMIACNVAFKEGQSNPKIKQLEWSEEQSPNKNIRYNHVTATSPLGKYSIEWKGWKEYDDRTICLDGDFVSVGGFVLEDAKKIAQSHFEARIKECLITE